MNIKNLIFLCIMMTHAADADELANRKFRSALSACEKALQMEPPKSYGSLSRLNSLLKRYQRDRDEALEISPSLKDSSTQLYKGDFFVGKPFVEAYRVCEGELTNKVSQAEVQIKQMESNRKTRQQQVFEQSDELMEKMDLAKGYIATAINQYCASYLRAPAPQNETMSTLYEKYQQGKQKALEIYPDIVKQFHRAIIIDPESGDEQAVSKTIGSWFRYCDAKFTNQSEGPVIKKGAIVPVEAEGPMLPPSSPVAVQKPLDGSQEVNLEEGLDPEYEMALKSFKEDRLNVLTHEKRLPEFVDDEDNDLQKSKIWQYEDDEKCTTYTFQGDKLMKSKTTRGECESF